VIGPELIRQMRVELHAGLVTVVQIGIATDFTAAAGAEELSVRGGCGAGSPVARKRLAVLFIDERRQRLRIAFIADVPVGGPRELPPTARTAGLRHARESEIDTIGQDGRQEGLSLGCWRQGPHFK